jgi:phytoene dehydrogenase-like protein
MTYDVVVIGSGINGLVAAAELAGAGWSVCLVERNERLGGFMASDQLTRPGYVHDTFSAWHPLFVTGGAYAVLGADLARHGLTYANTDGAVTASAARDGRHVVAYRDPEATTAAFAVESDRMAYVEMLGRLGADIDVIGALLGTELRGLTALGPLATLARRGRQAGVEGWTRDLAASGRRWAARHFSGGEVDHLWAPWLLHAGLAPDSASGGLMIPLLAGTMHGAGLPVPVGGQGAFVAAFERLLRERGVEIRLGASVDRIVVAGGRATGVVVGEEMIRADRAVLASVTPSALYDELLTDAPAKARTEARQYRYGRGAMQVHVALSKPLEWGEAALRGIPLVHLSDGSGSTGVACAQAEAGVLPGRPTVVVGQQHLLDPTRCPDGAGMLWLQLQEVPFRPTGDARAELDTAGGWTPELTQGYVDRVLDLVEEQAPGTKASVLEWKALTPVDLTQANVNCVAGDPYCGSAELDQNLVWRPGPTTSRHRTVVPGVWHIGAATHPGPGLGGGSGHLVAQSIIKAAEGRLSSLRQRLSR